ncbi:MAG: DnaB-like helicase C-terminal domain-containing protein [Planctomycetota bacterium]
MANVVDGVNADPKDVERELSRCQEFAHLTDAEAVGLMRAASDDQAAASFASIAARIASEPGQKNRLDLIHQALSDTIAAQQIDSAPDFFGAFAGEAVRQLLDPKAREFRRPTGHEAYDRLTAGSGNAGGGILPGTMVTVAGRPGRGKSTFAFDVARCAAKTGWRPLIVTLEVPRHRLIQNVLAAEVGFDKRISKDKFARLPAHATFEELEAASGCLESLAIQQPKNRQIGSILATAETFIAAHGSDLVMIDYLGKLQGDDRKQTRENYAVFCREIQAFAMHSGVPVMVMAQVNRKVESESGDGDERQARMSDLNESAALEHDSDEIIFLRRMCKPDWRILPGDPENFAKRLVCRTELNLAKSRDGETRVTEADFDMSRGIFIDAPRSGAEE